MKKLLLIFVLIINVCMYAQLSTSVSAINLKSVSGIGTPPLDRKIIISDGGSPISFKIKMTGVVGNYGGSGKYMHLCVLPFKYYSPIFLDTAQIFTTSSGSYTIVAYLSNYNYYSYLPGNYSGQVEIINTANSSDKVIIPVSYEIVQSNFTNPVFNSITGPVGCGFVFPVVIDTCSSINAKPAGSFVTPSRGQSYIDPNYGAKVTVASDLNGHSNGYSATTSISAKNNNIIYNGDQTHSVNLFRGNPQGTLVDSAMGIYTPSLGYVKWQTPETMWWDSNNDSIFYGMADFSLVKYNAVTKKTIDVIADLSQAPYNLASFQTGGTADINKYNFLPFFDFIGNNVGVININKKEVYIRSMSLDDGNVPINDGNQYGEDGGIDFMLLAKDYDKTTGKLYMITASNPCMAVYSIDTINKKLDFEYRGPERFGPGFSNGDGNCDPGESCFGAPHMDSFEDDQHNQYLLYASPRNDYYRGVIGVYLINKGDDIYKDALIGGGFTPLLCFYVPPASFSSNVPFCQDADFHFGGARNAPVAVISNYTHGRPKHPNYYNYFGVEKGDITILVATGGKFNLRRLCKHRNIPWSSYGNLDLTTMPLNENWHDSGYTASPRANLSQDGKLVLYNTNFGDPQNGMGIAVAETQADDFYTSIKENKKDSNRIEFSITPNPSTGFISVNAEFNLTLTHENYLIKITDMLGRIMYYETITAETFINKTINCSECKNGIYFVTLSGRNLIGQTQKIIIRH